MGSSLAITETLYPGGVRLWETDASGKNPKVAGYLAR